MSYYRKILPGLIIFFSLVPKLSYATLGEDVSSIHNDNKVLASTVSQVVTRTSPQTNNYQTSIISTPDNLTIKEYSANGKVFAISWVGSKYPNFKQLLGNYFSQLKTAKKFSGGFSSSQLNGNDFVFRMSGLPGILSGFAYVNSLVPDDVNINEVK
jgi:hypothetical protein